jgi:ATP-dependent 26S proteasome regulatory subunit
MSARLYNLVRGIDLKKIALKMNGASGAESKAVCTEAVGADGQCLPRLQTHL